MTHTSRRLMQTAASGAAALALVLSLSGCSGSNKTTVCTDAIKVITDGTNELSGSISKAAAGDVGPMNQAFTNTSTKLTDLVGKTDDAALKSAITGVADVFAGAKLTAPITPSALTGAPQKFADAINKLRPACT